MQKWSSREEHYWLLPPNKKKGNRWPGLVAGPAGYVSDAQCPDRHTSDLLRWSARVIALYGRLCRMRFDLFDSCWCQHVTTRGALHVSTDGMSWLCRRHRRRGLRHAHASLCRSRSHLLSVSVASRDCDQQSHSSMRNDFQRWIILFYCWKMLCCMQNFSLNNQ